ncbi:MAG TPA: S41 family peptidase [Candidatus Eisenbacteria bacterium]
MDRATRAMLALYALLLLALSFLAASARADDDMPVDAAMRAAVVDSTARFVRDNYVDSLAGVRLSDAVRRARAAGRYERCATASALCDSLTATLQSVVRDPHLHVDYSVRPRPMAAGTGEPSPEERARQDAESGRRNFGFARVERLPGNVGYLDLRRFERPDLAGATAVAAMALLQGSDAVILDLRKNGGGYGEMGMLLASYFFGWDPIHLSDVIDRPERVTMQQWTFPYVPGSRLAGVDLYVLTSRRTFSAAEGLTYALKNRGRAVIVGERTRGGAHPVLIRQVNEHFAVFVPRSRVVDAVTGTDWEGAGIAPDVEAPAERALDVAYLEALKKIRARTAAPDEDLTRAIEDATRALETKPAPSNPTSPQPK